jgi:type I restriction enzyme M protein
MPKTEAKAKSKTKASDTRSFEAQLWEACEAQRGSVNASRYKHPVLGLVFLKYVNDNFDSHHPERLSRARDG